MDKEYAKAIIKRIYIPWLLNMRTFHNIMGFGIRGENERVYYFAEHKLLPNQLLGEEYYSQEYQDVFLDLIIFQKKRDGFFLDIGANDPCFINNTYFFEKRRGWKGVAFEPIRSKAAKWKEYRTTECLNVALGALNKDSLFYEHERDYESRIVSNKEAVRLREKGKNVYRISMRRLGDILKEKGITQIDYCSMDVEGFEYEVLQGIDFRRITINCFSIELTKNNECKRVRSFLIKNGYVFVARLWQDDIWVKKELRRHESDDKTFFL